MTLGTPDGGHRPPNIALVDHMEELSRDDAILLLTGASFGRVGVTMGALPAILPVSYTIFDDAIVFRTWPGTRLAAAVRDAVVAFEVDQADPDSRRGWSVMVVGRAREISEPERLERAHALRLQPWAEGLRGQLVEIPLDIVSGRRIKAD